jgi:hypothetical protein
MRVKDWLFFFIHHWTITRIVRWAFIIGITVITGIYLFDLTLIQHLTIKIILLFNLIGGMSLAYIMGWTLGVSHKDEDKIDRNEK